MRLRIFLIMGEMSVCLIMCVYVDVIYIFFVRDEGCIGI